MGIVTWANVKVEYLPQANKLFFLPFDRIENAIEPLYKIQRHMIGLECFLLNKLNLGIIFSCGVTERVEKRNRTIYRIGFLS